MAKNKVQPTSKTSRNKFKRPEMSFVHLMEKARIIKSRLG